MLADSESVLELGKYGKLQLLVSFRVTASLALNKDRRLIGMGGTFWARDSSRGLAANI